VIVRRFPSIEYFNGTRATGAQHPQWNRENAPESACAATPGSGCLFSTPFLRRLVGEGAMVAYPEREGKMADARKAS
jgi:hypothetical protein